MLTRRNIQLNPIPLSPSLTGFEMALEEFKSPTFHETSISDGELTTIETTVSESELTETVSLVQPEVLIFQRPVELTSRDWAVFLLHSAAEVEHALMVQYLFAAYSLRLDVALPTAGFTNDWQDTLIEIAKEEMGHLLTVQNLLRLIGGPLCFEREDFPLRTAFYPFPFTLEKLTKDSLSKYLFAEISPDEIPPEIISPDKRKEIEDRAKKAVGYTNGSFINHVGTLYRTVKQVFESELDPSDFRADRNEWLSLGWSQTNDDFDSLSGVKLLPTRNRGEALQAIEVIAEQGEASTATGSHFTRFLRIYDACPEITDELTFPVVDNPTVNSDDLDANQITRRATVLQALLFNLRYRVILAELYHVAAVLPSAVTPGDVSVRRLLQSWIYLEMVRDSGSLRDLALNLVQQPVSEGASKNAGPTFGLPYTWAFPDLELERWLLHRDLIRATEQIISELRELTPDDPNLEAITARDQTRTQVIETILKAPA